MSYPQFVSETTKEAVKEALKLAKESVEYHGYVKTQNVEDAHDEVMGKIITLLTSVDEDLNY